MVHSKEHEFFDHQVPSKRNESYRSFSHSLSIVFGVMCMRACAVSDRSHWANINLRGKIIDVCIYMCVWGCLVNYRSSQLRLEGKFDWEISLNTFEPSRMIVSDEIEEAPWVEENGIASDFSFFSFSFFSTDSFVIVALFFLSLHRFHSTRVWSLFLFILTTSLTISFLCPCSLSLSL